MCPLSINLTSQREERLWIRNKINVIRTNSVNTGQLVIEHFKPCHYFGKGGKGIRRFWSCNENIFFNLCKALKYTYDPPPLPPPLPYHHHHLSWQLIGNKVSIFPFLRFVGYDRFPPPFPLRIIRPPPQIPSSPTPFPGDK